GGRRAAADPHRARRRLRDPRAMSVARLRLAPVGETMLALLPFWWVAGVRRVAALALVERWSAVTGRWRGNAHPAPRRLAVAEAPATGRRGCASRLHSIGCLRSRVQASARRGGRRRGWW